MLWSWCAVHRNVISMVFAGCSLATLGGAARASEDPSDPLEGMSLQELLDVDVSAAAASQQSQALRDSPGVVSLITRTEIQRSGARDLQDILSRVPGFWVGVDTPANVSLGFRGLWGEEGKILLLVDGQEFNEGLYGNLSLGNHITADLIQSVEVIRGPGSVQYGGHAELAVIKVTTLGAELRGVFASGYYGQMPHDFGRRTLSAVYGDSVDAVPGLSGSIGITVGQGNRTDQVLVDTQGKSVSLGNGNSRTDPFKINASLNQGDWHLRYIYDQYYMTSRNSYAAVQDSAFPEHFSGHYLDLHHDGRIGDRLLLSERIAYRDQLPWQSDFPDPAVFFNRHFQQLIGNVHGTYTFASWLDATVGAEAYDDRGSHGPVPASLAGQYNPTYENGRDVIFYQDIGAYAEAHSETFVGNFVAGGRFEYHTSVGTAFVPRFAYTKRLGQVHVKALYSQAFRMPDILNLTYGVSMKPEKTSIAEAEVGWQINEHYYVSANVFDITIKQPIVYSFDPLSQTNYLNFSQTGSRGVEAEARAHYAWGDLTAQYSLYRLGGKNEVPVYNVPADPQLALAFPAHKFTITSSFRLGSHLRFSPSLVAISERYGYADSDSSGNILQRRFAPNLILNAFLEYQDAFTRGLSLGLGGYNLLNQTVEILQPFASGGAPLPAGSREVGLRITYQLSH